MPGDIQWKVFDALPFVVVFCKNGDINIMKQMKNREESFSRGYFLCNLYSQCNNLSSICYGHDSDNVVMLGNPLILASCLFMF